MPTFTQISPEKEKELQSKLIRKQFYTPEQNLASILTARYKSGIKQQKFHFIALVNGNEIFLFDHLRRSFGSAPKTNKGLGRLHQLAVKIFTDAGKNHEPRNGGFCFDFYMGLRKIDLTVGVNVEKLEE